MNQGRMEETTEYANEAKTFFEELEVDREQMTRSVLTNPGLDWLAESARIERLIEELMLEIAPMVYEASRNPAGSTQTRSQANRGKIIREQYNIVITMEFRRQLIMRLIGA